ncbi:MarR family winged helix-turn-helix transcriptional regulator [Rhizorhabdus sp.]|jgi:DNA-binding MarR family transcriptional regulator|uniref:MarR family winged helix-turn-helix transcriptional regulator n=1 Tax=Rhizorhabdus sp. TaxID=1968843 RepID=UPI0019CDC80B|nr:MarR family winged helix-turn-helix transcriptional regulator [Rhizorhabdus sp.]MBD3759603.1 winged helix-turn-helix transcriptional regulator [Rhizorhabdus sp.]
MARTQTNLIATTAPGEGRAERFFDIWRRMRRGDIVRQLNQLFQGGVDPALSSGEIDVIMALDGRPDGYGMTDLTLIVAADPGNVTRTVNQLLAKGYVHRFLSVSDARERFVKLSSHGIAAAERQNRLREAVFALALGHLSASGQDRLLIELEIALNALSPSSLAALALQDFEINEAKRVGIACEPQNQAII